MMNRIVLFALILIISSSCNRKIQRGIGLEEIPFKINCDKLTHLRGEGIDSQIGTIVCDDIMLSYDYGLYSNSIPESMIESFSKSFYAYHHSKFFDAIFIDKRMIETFKDSVQIMKVDNQIVDEKYILNCKDCNATAYLKFNDITFLYPFIVNEIGNSLTKQVTSFLTLYFFKEDIRLSFHEISNFSFYSLALSITALCQDRINYNYSCS